METRTPIEFLKNRLVELKTMSGIDPNLIVEYEKAIMVLELIGGVALEDKTQEQPIASNTDLSHDEPGKAPKSYFEKFMENQRDKKGKSK